MKKPHSCLSCAALAFTCASLLTLPGCVTMDDAPHSHVAEVPWPQDGAPSNMTLMAEDLMTFQAATNALPLNLAQLDRSHLGSAKEPYAARGYLYQPSGLGVLREGWRVLAVNDRVLVGQDGHLWAVLVTPVRLHGAPTLQVAKVSLTELEEAGKKEETKKAEGK